MEEALSANDRDEDDAQHRVSLVTSEHGYTMLLPQMDDDSDHHDNSILNSYSTNMSDEEGFQSNGDDMGDLHIHSNAIADVDSLDKSPKYVDIQLGIDLSVPTEGDCKELKSISSPADSCNIVASTNHCFAKSDPILASTSQIMLSRQQIADVVLQGNNRVVVPSSGSLADNQGLSRNHMLQSASDDSVIQFARPVQPVCLKIFYSTNNAVEVYECKWLDCTRKCTSLNDLVNHVNDDHVKLGYGKEIEYKCFWKECPRKGKGFNARYKMLIHVRTHTNEKPHSCATCGKCFSRLENLKIHTRSHTGERPYLCPVQGCSKAYSNSSDRFKHVRTHQEDKPYSCRMPGCNKRYTDPSSLRKHIKTNRHQYTGNTAQENVQVKILDGARNFFTTQGHKPPIETAQGTVIQPQTLMQHPAGAPNVPSDAAIVMYTPPANGGAPANRSPLGTHVNIITLQNFLHPRPTSNPLLSSTIAQTNTNGQLAVKETPLTLTNSITESPVKDLPSDSPLVEEEGKDQEAPLDLSKSPTLETDDNSRMDSSSYKPKWDIISMDD